MIPYCMVKKLATEKALSTIAIFLGVFGTQAAGLQTESRVPIAEAAMILDSAGQSLSRMFEEVADSVVVVDSPSLISSATGWGGSQDQSTEGAENGVSDEVQLDLSTLSETGSGIVFTDDGHILTNYHVIENAPSNDIKIKTRDGTIKKAAIIGTDYKTDLAVLRMQPPYPPALRQGNSDLVRTGQFVAAIGSPYGLEYTLTVGIVSGRGRNPLTGSAYEDYIQTDAAINPGNSGGPLLNMRGEWVGVNTLMNGINRGLGFSIPSNQAAQIGREIIKRGSVTRPWIGIRASRPEGMQEQGGVGVDWVGEGSPAARAGIKQGDIIFKVNGKVVNTPSQLQREIWDTGVGKRLVVDFLRSGRARQRTIETIPMPNITP